MRQDLTSEKLQEVARVDVLSTDDVTLVRLGSEAARGIDMESLKIVDFNNITDDRHVSILVLRISDEQPETSK